MIDLQADEEKEIKRYGENPRSFGDFVSHRYVAFALKKRGLEKESKKAFLAAAKQYRSSIFYGYELGNSSPSDVGKLYEQAGKRLHAAKYYLLSTHKLNYQDRERLNLTDRELDYAKRSAQERIKRENNGLCGSNCVSRHYLESFLNSVEENVKMLNENRGVYLKGETQ